jgi:hypothetical protein
MLDRILCFFLLLVSVFSYGLQRATINMRTESVQAQISKSVAAAMMGISLIAPLPTLADGAISQSTIFRARNTYGRRILDLGEAAAKGNFAAFSDRKVFGMIKIE